MATDTKIQWTDHTFNPWRGCTKVSAGCTHCYAETMSKRNPGTLGIWGDAGTRIVASEATWKEPLKWDKAAAKAGERRRVFCASMSDMFEDWTSGKGNPKPIHGSNGQQLFKATDGGWIERPLGQFDSRWVPATLGDVRQRLFDLIVKTPNLDWQLLTKRPENVLPMTHDAWTKKVPGHVQQNDGDGRHWHWPRNVWLGVSVENQAAAYERIPILLQTPATVLFLSVEPMLGPVDLTQHFPGGGSRNYLSGQFFGIRFKGANGHPDFIAKTVDDNLPHIHWVIVGGESGPKARPFDLAWARSIIRQCRAAGVACFMKQAGSNVVCRNDEISDWFDECGHLACQHERPRFQGEAERIVGFRDKKGGDLLELPEDLRIREMPR